MKCKYCNEEIKGKYVNCLTAPKRPLTTLLTDEPLDPKYYTPIREQVCEACMEDMGVRIG